MELGTLVSLYQEFERECALRNLPPTFITFTLWVEVTHHLIFSPYHIALMNGGYN
jgi:hypothetical protein